jgi:hypothetical protein
MRPVIGVLVRLFSFRIFRRVDNNRRVSPPPQPDQGTGVAAAMSAPLRSSDASRLDCRPRADVRHRSAIRLAGGPWRTKRSSVWNPYLTPDPEMCCLVEDKHLGDEWNWT